ncbi:MAG: hypothetical protein US33_C0040G0002 [Parcubacteria group bacterium GW2011_GWC1_36_9]|nr:MAG: hypothetical protein US33_C0040G0002 [Parcubacteria group bacterium GW2011_GWC1_36_9]
MDPVVRGVCLTNKLNSSTPKTETMPKTGPKNPPAIGPKKSKRVNETFDPMTLLKGICRVINPTIEKSAKKRSCLRIFNIENLE